ncbi:MAG: hypothetical protein GXO67_08150 [Archaeoglobi archaeon]|nr:hypothetical protein [Archaeoglobi archaeon]
MDLLKLYRMAREFDGSPAELQSLLREECEDVVSVGDDLSFVVRFPEEVRLSEDTLAEIGGRKRKLYPFRNAWFFERGYIAWDGRFLRISREIDESVLKKILASLNVDG